MSNAKQSKGVDAPIGFDVDPPVQPTRKGLSPSEKGLLGLALFAVLGAVGLVADVIAARDGQTPASGFDQLAADDDRATSAPGHARASDVAQDAPVQAEGLADDAQASAHDSEATTTGIPSPPP